MYSFNVTENAYEYIVSITGGANTVRIQRYNKYGDPLIYDLSNKGGGVFSYPKNEEIYGEDFILWVNGSIVYEVHVTNYQSKEEINEITERAEIPKHPIEGSKSSETSFYKTLNATIYKDDFVICFPDFTNALILTYTIPDSEDYTPINQVTSVTREEYEQKKTPPVDDDGREKLFSNDDNFSVYYVYENEETEHLGAYYLLAYNGVSYFEIPLPSYRKPTGLRQYRSSVSRPNLNESVNLVTPGVGSVNPIGYSATLGFLRGSIISDGSFRTTQQFHPYKKQIYQNRYSIEIDGRTYVGRGLQLYATYNLNYNPPMIKNEYRELSEVLISTPTKDFEGDIFMDYVRVYAEVPQNTYTTFTGKIEDSTGNKAPGLRMR